jgi:hypothetical protein
MSKRNIGIVVLLVCSEIVGVGAGHWFFEVFKITVPPASVSDFMRASAYGYFVANGVGLGFVLFLFTLGALLLRRFFAAPEGPKANVAP